MPAMLTQTPTRTRPGANTRIVATISETSARTRKVIILDHRKVTSGHYLHDCNSLRECSVIVHHSIFTCASLRSNHEQREAYIHILEFM